MTMDFKKQHRNKQKQFRDPLQIMLKSPDLDYFFVADQLSDKFSKPSEWISDLKLICTQSWGDIEAV